MRCVSDVPAGGDDGAGGGDDGDPGGEYQAARPGWQQPHAVIKGTARLAGPGRVDVDGAALAR
jgi:hypothetical protein